jgi:hypothetical protein
MALAYGSRGSNNDGKDGITMILIPRWLVFQRYQSASSSISEYQARSRLDFLKGMRGASVRPLCRRSDCACVGAKTKRT